MLAEKKKKQPGRSRHYRLAVIFLGLIVLLAVISAGLVRKLSRPPQILFNSANGGLLLMNLDTTEITDITPSTLTRPLYGARWSPDGTRIVFYTSLSLNARGIFVMHADGSNLTSLTDDIPDAWNPDWSPDGKKIIYQTASNHQHVQFEIMNADGSDKVILPRPPDSAMQPRWSPDGKYIAFYTLPDYTIYIMNADGTNIQRVGPGAAPIWLMDSSGLLVYHAAKYDIVDIHNFERTAFPIDDWLPGSGVGTMPSLSPDGRQAGMVVEEGGSAVAYSVNLDGTHPRRLMPDNLTVSFEWQPDPCGAWDLLCYLLLPS